MTSIVDKFLDARDLIRERGWAQGHYEKSDGSICISFSPIEGYDGILEFLNQDENFVRRLEVASCRRIAKSMESELNELRF